jgi:DNA-directed RNA polymerase specialized sigma24 family protein
MQCARDKRWPRSGGSGRDGVDVTIRKRQRQGRGNQVPADMLHGSDRRSKFRKNADGQCASALLSGESSLGAQAVDRCSFGVQSYPCVLVDTELQAILRALIANLIRALEPDFADIVWRAEVLGHSTPAIAQTLGLSEGVVASRLRIGRRRLVRLIALALETPQKA